MIKLENGNKSQILVKSESPLPLFYSLLSMSIGTFFYVFTDGTGLLINGIVLLMVSVWNSKKANNFKEFCKLPSLILLLGVLIFIIYSVIAQIAGDFGLVIFGTYLDNETLISINFILQLSILIALIASLVYTTLTGRKKEVANYLSKGYKITNLNELDKKELKIVNKAKSTISS